MMALIIDRFLRDFEELPENIGNIPIRKLYVNAAQNYPSVREVENNFGIYGRIQNISLSPKRIFFFITFFEPGDAKKVLSKEVRRKLNLRYNYYIKPADQWHQPLMLEGNRVLWDRNEAPLPDCSQEVSHHSTDPSKPSLMDLNDDCLLLILNYLSLRQLIGIERVCKRMRSLSMELWSRVTVLNFHNIFQSSCPMRVDNLREILLRCGKSLTSLDLIACQNELKLIRAIPQIVKLCPTLRELDISDYVFNDLVVIKNFAPVLKNLHVLKINSATFIGRTWQQFSNNLRKIKVLEANCVDIENDKIGEYLPTSLTVLNLDGTQVSINEIAHLTNLTVLQLGRAKLSLNFVVKTFPHIKELTCSDLWLDKSVPLPKGISFKRLVLKNYQSSCRAPTITDIATMFPTLEHLSLTDENDSVVKSYTAGQFGKLARLKCLKLLHLKHLPINDDILTEIAVHTLGTIEDFSCHFCTNVSERGCISIVNSSPRLKRLDISKTSVNLENFVLEMMNSEIPSFPITIVLHGFDSDSDFLRDCAYFKVEECFGCHCKRCSFGDDADSTFADILAHLNDDLHLDFDSSDYEYEDALAGFDYDTSDDDDMYLI